MSDASVFVYVEELNAFTYADSSGYFSIDLLNLSLKSVILVVQLGFYYLHNYKVAHSTHLLQMVGLQGRKLIL